MKSKQNLNKRNKRSSVNEFDEKNGLKPVKSKNSKSKRISIYDELDDDFDLDMENYSFSDPEIEEGLYEDDDDY